MRIRVVDAFTEHPFGGNPAGVVLLDGPGWPDEEWMRRVAAELKHSETAFAHPLDGDPDADWALRWFTPAVEANLCGHATLATTHVMRSDGLITGPVRFSTKSGVLVASLGEDGTITLDFPRAVLTEVPVPDGLGAALGTSPVTVRATGALGDLLVVLPDEKTVRALTPDFGALSTVSSAAALRGVIVTAEASEPGHYDFVSRFFAPLVGVPEDPVTGSAHTALAPYWVDRLGRDNLTGYQASPRGGLVRTSLAGNRVHLTGTAVTVLDGTFHA